MFHQLPAAIGLDPAHLRLGIGRRIGMKPEEVLDRFEALQEGLAQDERLAGATRLCSRIDHQSKTSRTNSQSQTCRCRSDGGDCGGTSAKFEGDRFYEYTQNKPPEASGPRSPGAGLESH